MLWQRKLYGAGCKHAPADCKPAPAEKFRNDALKLIIYRIMLSESEFAEFENFQN